MQVEMKYRGTLNQSSHNGALSATVPVDIALRKTPDGVILYAKNEFGTARITIPSVSFRRMLKDAGL